MAGTGLIGQEALATYLARLLGSAVEIAALRALAGGEAADPKGLGYGVPFEVECVVGGQRRSFVVSRTRPVQGRGHDYPAGSGDRELFDVLPPFFMFRALVLAHPRWYPSLTDVTRRTILDFARAMAEVPAFDPVRLPAPLGRAA
jgi:hypothetical protein